MKFYKLFLASKKTIFFSLRKKELPAALLFSALAPSAARADVTFVNLPQLKINGHLDVGGAGFLVPNANFGAGSNATLNGRKRHSKSPSTGEFYFQPGLDASYKLGQTTLFANVSFIGATSWGWGDAMQNSQNAGNPFMFKLEEANGGIKIPVFGGGEANNIVVQGGRQVFKIDDAFLIGKGTYSAGARGAWWNAPRFAFSGPGVVHFNTTPVRADIFVLENNSSAKASRGFDRPETKFVGFDVSWFDNAEGKQDGASTYSSRKRYVTLTYFRIYDADDTMTYARTAYAGRKNLNVYSLNFGGNVLPVDWLNIKDDFNLYGQYVGEYSSYKSPQGYDGVDAYAYYIQPAYTFSSLPTKPRLYYKFTRFSGQSNPNGSVKRSYDTLFLYNGTRDLFGGFFFGEAVGEYMLPMSGIDVHQVGLNLYPDWHIWKPDDQIKLDLVYYHANLNHPRQYGIKPGIHHFSDEVDVGFEYKYDPTFSFATLVGIALPGRAGKEMVKSGLTPEEMKGYTARNTGIIEAYFYKRF